MTRRQEHLRSLADIKIAQGDFQELCHEWERPTCIVSDGAYGVRGFPGDPPTADELPDWYRPHVEAWSERALPSTTLWFWNTELGWASVHPLLVENGWEFRNCHIWDKGIAHIAGNANSKTLRKFPVVTEVCVQYVRRNQLRSGFHMLPLKEWLRSEWERSGLPLYVTNRACGVRNAATRKYFTKDHLWYFPPPEAFAQLAAYANKHGEPTGRPYFSENGRRSISAAEWTKMRAKFYCDHGITNVWQEPAVRGSERLKSTAFKCAHGNQKPLRLLKTIVESCTDAGDVVWEPFGGLCSVAVACLQTGRRCYSSEISSSYFDLAIKRLEQAGAASSASTTPRVAAG
jgi:site-specific DNA-methyltransferase (adenine-specific)